MNNPQLVKLINAPSTNITQLLDSLDQKNIGNLLSYLSKKYYNEAHVTTDKIYDMINDYYTEKYGLITSVGAKVKNEVKLPIYMNSLNKIKTPNEIELFKKRNGTNYVISPKLDGISTLLVKKGNDISLYTRGDGFKGRDISYILPHIDLNTSLLTENDIMFRGELVISKHDYAIVNANNYYSHPRNFAISVTNSKKSSKPELLKYLSFISYFVLIDGKYDMLKTEQLNFIASKKFNNKPFNYITTNNLNYDDLVKYHFTEMTNNDYILDGLVVSNNDASFPIIVGEKHPKYETAFKHDLEESIKPTKVIEVEWNISKNGLLKPTVIFEPVNLDGYNVKNATGNNAKYVLDNGIDVGADILVILSGGVIPKILQVVKPSVVNIPQNVSWDGVDIRPNDISVVEMKEQVIKQMVYFCKIIDIDFVKEKTMEKIIDEIIKNKGVDGNKYLNFNEDLEHNILFEFVQLKMENFMKIPRFGVELSQKILGEFGKLQNIPIEKLMDASQMFKRIGTKKLKLMFADYPNFIEMYKNEIDKDKLIITLNDINGYEEITSTAIVDGMVSFVPWMDRFQQIIPNLLEATNPATNVPSQPINNEFSQFNGMKIVFTGFRDKDIEMKIEKAGGKVVGSVSKNTNLVVAKDVNEDSSKIKTAHSLNITVISQEEFYEMLVSQMKTP